MSMGLLFSHTIQEFWGGEEWFGSHYTESFVVSISVFPLVAIPGSKSP